MLSTPRSVSRDRLRRNDVDPETEPRGRYQVRTGPCRCPCDRTEDAPAVIRSASLRCLACVRSAPACRRRVTLARRPTVENNCSPPLCNAPIAAWPSADVSHSAQSGMLRLASAPGFAELSSIAAYRLIRRATAVDFATDTISPRSFLGLVVDRIRPVCEGLREDH
jgi:hypothetical protein